jgi:large subunit ribosomal protein L5
MQILDLEKTYKDAIVQDLARELGDTNVHALPRITKVVLNVGVGRMAYQRRLRASAKQTEEELIADVVAAIIQIGAQRPRVIIATRSIAGFKLRAGTVVGLSTTLRGRRMYDFLARLINIALPRTRDFRGILRKAVDAHGNLTIGVRDVSIFPEAGNVTAPFGFEITVVTNTHDRTQAMALFNRMGIPFAKET